MDKPPARQRQQLLATTVLMGTGQNAEPFALATYKVPGVYIEEIPSGANG